MPCPRYDEKGSITQSTKEEPEIEIECNIYEKRYGSAISVPIKNHAMEENQTKDKEDKEKRRR